MADADQPEAEVCLEALLIEGEVDQRPANQPDHQRPQPGVQQGEPHHVAGDLQGMVGDHQRQRAGDRPQDGDEGEQRHQAGEQPQGQGKGAVGQGAQILGDTLVGVIDRLLHLGMVVGLMLEPTVHIAPGHPLAPQHLQPLGQIDAEDSDGDIDKRQVAEADQLRLKHRIVTVL